MNKHYWKLLLLFPILMNSCMTLLVTTNPPIKQGFLINIIDFDGNPVEGAKVSYKIENEDRGIKDTTEITKNDGRILHFVQARAGLSLKLLKPANSPFFVYLGPKWTSLMNAFSSA